MLKLEVDGDGYEVAANLRHLVDEHIGGLDKFMDALDRGHVSFAPEGGSDAHVSVHAQVWGSRHHFEATGTDRIAEKALDDVRRKLEKQIRRSHSKDIDRHHHG